MNVSLSTTIDDDSSLLGVAAAVGGPVVGFIVGVVVTVVYSYCLPRLDSFSAVMSYREALRE